MANKADRDFDLAGRADEVATALLQRNIPGDPTLTQGMRLYAREAVLRHRDLVLNLMPATMEYSVTMDEVALRRWAASVVEALRT